MASFACITCDSDQCNKLFQYVLKLYSAWKVGIFDAKICKFAALAMVDILISVAVSSSSIARMAALTNSNLPITSQFTWLMFVAPLSSPTSLNPRTSPVRTRFVWASPPGSPVTTPSTSGSTVSSSVEAASFGPTYLVRTEIVHEQHVRAVHWILNHAILSTG